MNQLEVMTKIISERQPITLAKVRQFANSYVEWRGYEKEEMYDFIRKNFYVDSQNFAHEEKPFKQKIKCKY